MRIKNLSEIVDIYLSNVDKKTIDGETPVALCNFTDVYYNWDVNESDVPGFMKATATKKEIARFSIREGDVLLTKDSETRDDIGMSCYVSGDLGGALLGYHCALLRPKPGAVDGAYLNAYLQSPLARKYFSNQASGSGQRYTLSVDGIGAVKIPLPDDKTQKQIAGFLQAITQKIRVNRLMTDKLKQLARTLYEQFFLQFSFSSEALIEDVMLGRKRPSSWGVAKASNIFTIMLGGTPDTSKSEYWNGQFHWLNSGEVANFPIVDSELTITQMGIDNSPSKLMPKNTTLVSITGNIRATVTAIEACANQSVVGILPNDSFHASYIYPVMCDLLSHFTAISGGNCQKHINKGTIENLQILQPPIGVLQDYYSRVDPLFETMATLAEETKTLHTMRDSLLPLLLNGQVTIQ